MSDYTDELEFVCEIVRGSAAIAQQLFMGDNLQVFTKEDGSEITNIDLDVNKYVTVKTTQLGWGLRSEEGGNAQYGENWVLDFDEIDGTRELVEGYSRHPRIAHAAPAGALWNNEPVAGAAAFSLLGVPTIMYSASKGGGMAYREQEGQIAPFWINSEPTRGIVLITARSDTPDAKRVIIKLWEMGYTPVPVHGDVFKACMVADNALWNIRYGSDPGLPIVGSLSRKLRKHDVAAVTCIINEAGGIATIPISSPENQPWVSANNPVVYSDLWELATAPA